MTHQNPDELKIMKREIDALQIEVMKGRLPWYRSPSIIISIVALLFSFGTTFVSYYKTARLEVQAARTELRGILQRLSALPKDNFELIRKYRDDPEGLALSGLLTQENALLARQASEIVDRYPNEISAVEYASLAHALAVNSDYAKVPLYFERALARTSDPNSKVAILRGYGMVLMTTGQVTEGRRKYEKALSIWSDYPYVSDYFKDSTDAYTEMHWSQAEASINNFEEARVHIRKALAIVGSLPPSPNTTQLNSPDSFYSRHE
jgi:tetratricopeptide (TPR) repeat protein